MLALYLDTCILVQWEQHRDQIRKLRERHNGEVFVPFLVFEERVQQYIQKHNRSRENAEKTVREKIDGTATVFGGNHGDYINDDFLEHCFNHRVKINAGVKDSYIAQSVSNHFLQSGFRNGVGIFVTGDIDGQNNTVPFPNAILREMTVSQGALLFVAPPEDLEKTLAVPEKIQNSIQQALGAAYSEATHLFESEKLQRLVLETFKRLVELEVMPRQRMSSVFTKSVDELEIEDCVYNVREPNGYSVAVERNNKRGYRLKFDAVLRIGIVDLVARLYRIYGSARITLNRNDKFGGLADIEFGPVDRPHA